MIVIPFKHLFLEQNRRPAQSADQGSGGQFLSFRKIVAPIFLIATSPKMDQLPDRGPWNTSSTLFSISRASDITIIALCAPLRTASERPTRWAFLK